MSDSITSFCLKESGTCALCSQPSEELELLDCQHSICTYCLRKRESRNSYQCQICSADEQTPPALVRREEADALATNGNSCRIDGHRNELDRFCMDCKIKICKDCISSGAHIEHTVQQLILSYQMHRSYTRNLEAIILEISKDFASKRLQLEKSRLNITNSVDKAAAQFYKLVNLKARELKTETDIKIEAEMSRLTATEHEILNDLANLKASLNQAHNSLNYNRQQNIEEITNIQNAIIAAYNFSLDEVKRVIIATVSSLNNFVYTPSKLMSMEDIPIGQVAAFRLNSGSGEYYKNWASAIPLIKIKIEALKKVTVSDVCAHDEVFYVLESDPCQLQVYSKNLSKKRENERLNIKKELSKHFKIDIRAIQIINTIYQIFIHIVSQEEKSQPEKLVDYILNLKQENMKLNLFANIKYDSMFPILACQQQTLLIAKDFKIFEINAATGEEIRTVNIPEECIVESADNVLVLQANRQYFVTSFNLRELIISVLTVSGSISKTFKKEMTNASLNERMRPGGELILVCTDDANYFLLLELTERLLNVFSMDLRKLHQHIFNFKINKIKYDKTRNKFILVTDGELLNLSLE